MIQRHSPSIPTSPALVNDVRQFIGISHARRSSTVNSALTLLYSQIDPWVRKKVPQCLTKMPTTALLQEKLSDTIARSRQRMDNRCGEQG
jgi:hypothetical protein